MRVLIIKMSSMGDVIHTLPALTDAKRQIPGIQFDWVVEEAFAEIPAWHDAVDRVIPVAIRRWRRHWLSSLRSQMFKAAWSALRQRRYDLVIDAQGLVKSALVATCAKGPRHGYGRASAREPFSARFYQTRHAVSRQLHAVERIRQLFAAALQYTAPTTDPDAGIRPHFLSRASAEKPYIVFLHNTTWMTKLWPEPYWQQLGRLANQAGYQVRLTSGNAEEKARADRIAESLDDAVALPRLEIEAVGVLLANAAGCVSVDTGFCHLAAAIAVPNVALFGPTNPVLTAPYGPTQLCLSAEIDCAPCLQKRCTHPQRQQEISPPCFQVIDPQRVWQQLQILLKK